MGCTALGHLFGTVFEGVLWGLYFILFLAAIFLFRRRGGKRSRSYQVMTAAMFWLFGTATAHFGVNIRSLQNGFSHISTNPTYAAVYFNDTTRPLYIVDKSLDVASMLVGNGLMIYRVHDMIPHGRWIVVFLVTLLLGTAAAECFATSRLASLDPADTIFAKTIKRVSPAAFTIPLILNISVTFLILLRIHQVERLASTRDGMHHLRFTRRMIITAFESSMILPVYFLVLVILYYAKSPMIEVVLIPIAQVIGIVPTIMWIQTRLGLTRYDAAIEHYAFTVSRDMQFATPERYPARPSHRPLECLFSETDLESDRTKDEVNSPVASVETFSSTTPKPPRCIPRGQHWQSPSAENVRGPQRREHPSSYR